MVNNNKLHIVAVVAVIRNNEGKYLVLKRSESEIAYPGQYTFPGGKVEGNDTVEETLIREAEEEAGLVLKPGKVLLKDKSFVRPDGQTAKVFSYLCEVEPFDEIKISEDFTNFKWVSYKELKDIHHVGIEGELIIADIINQEESLHKFKTKSTKDESSN
jgi:8-oxo-dGTP diphosphatase